MDEYIEGKFVKFKCVNSNMQIDCYHNISHGMELYVEGIVRDISDKVKCSSVVSLVSREICDLNREITRKNRFGVLEYYNILRKNFLNRRDILRPYLLVVIHGMRNRGDRDIEIGTGNGSLAKKEIIDWFVSGVRKEFNDFEVAVDKEFSGEKSLGQHRFGNNDIEGLGENFNVFQIELSKDIREKFRDEIVNGFVKVLRDFEERF